MKRRSLLTLAALAVVGLIAAGGASSSHRAAKPIIIGVANAQTGFVNFYDLPVLHGAELAVKDINAKGGLLGRPLKIVTADNKSDINQVQAAALDVLSRGANFVITTCDYDYGGPAARLANKKGILALSCAGGPLFGRQGIGPLTFNTMSGTPTEGAIEAEWPYYVKHWRHPYMLCDASLEYSKTVCQYFEARWKEIAPKGSIVGKDTFQNSDASIAGQITRLRTSGKGADFILLGSYPPGGASAIRQIRAAGIDLPIVGASAFDGTYWLSAVPGLTNFFYPAPLTQPGNPWRSPFIVRYAKTFGKVPTITYPLMGYADVQTLALGIQKAHSIDGAKVAKAIETFREQLLVTGPTTYTGDCHIPLGRVGAMIELTGNRAVYQGSYKPKGVPKSPC
jgi:branched-chain amino acid transport system substrate-binding protein